MENFFIDPHSPFFFKTRADLLVTAEFERRVISDRSRFGVWSARGQGRFIGVAPIGYSNARDEQDKPIITIHPEERSIVTQIYDDFLQDMTLPVIKERVAARGVFLKGHDTIRRILTNHTYAGLILTPNYKDETSKVVKGIHEAIIPEDKFWKAYYKMQDKITVQGPKMVDENVPLRGFLLCKGCGGFHTGGKSKGRSSYYYYYRCKKCLKENYNANHVHIEIHDILQGLSLTERDIKDLKTTANVKLEQALKDKQSLINKVQAEYDALNEKVNSLEEKYISNLASQATYEKWYPIYSGDLNKKRIQLEDLKKDGSTSIDLVNRYMSYLTDMGWIYDKADVGNKQSFLKGIFLGGFTKEEKGGRTAFLNPMFVPNSSKIGHLLRIEQTKKPDFSSGFLVSTDEGTRTPTPCGTRS